MKVYNVTVAAKIPPLDPDAAADMLIKKGMQVSFKRRGIVVDFDDPVRVVLKSGGVIWGTGSPDRKKVEDAIRRAASALGIQIRSLRVTNLTAVHVLTGKAKEVLDRRGLRGIETILPGSYLRTTRPPYAVVWKPKGKSLTMQIFSSGKVQIVGASSLAEAEEAVSRLENLLLLF